MADGWSIEPPSSGWTIEPPAPKPQDFRGGGLQGSPVGAAIAGAAQGVTFGLADEMKAGVRSLFNGQSYDDTLEHERNVLGQMRAEDPVASYGGEIAGSLLLPGAAMKSGASVGANALRMGLTGAAQGGAYGFGTGEDGAVSRARNAVVPAAVGGAIGAAAPFALRGVQKVMDKRETRAAVREAAANVDPALVKSQSQAIFKGLEGREVIFDDPASARLLKGIAADLQHFESDVAPLTLKRVGRLADKAENGLSFDSLMNTRESLGTVARNRATSDGAAAATTLKRIDEFVDGVMETDAVGDVAGLSDDWKQARTLWRQFKTSQRLQQAVERGADYAGGEEKGIKAGFRAILRDKKVKLSDGERQVIREVLKGSRIGNFIRDHANVVSGYIVGSAVGGGPIGGAVGAGVAKGLRMAGDRMGESATRDAAGRAVGFVAGGGQYAQPAPYLLPGMGNALRHFPAPGAVTADWTTR